MGYVFLGRTSGTIGIKTPDYEEIQYDVLIELPFDSSRKRMSVIVRNSVTDKYFLLCKGADNKMLPNCQLFGLSRVEIDEKLDSFACIGLRTLVLGMKQLSEEEAMDSMEKVAELKISKAKDKEAQMEALYDKIEVFA